MAQYRAYAQTTDSGIVTVTLENESAQFTLAPERGFKLFSAVVKNREIMMVTQDVTEMSAANGVPILFPYPNRTRDCRYSYGGHICAVEKNGEPRYLHGLMFDEHFAYTFGATGESAWCKGVCSITKDAEYFSAYPFPCTLEITYTFSGRSLRLDYKVTNDGDETLPYGFAIHPYFNKFGAPEDIEITVPADLYYEANEMLPTGKLLPAHGELDLRTPHCVAQNFIDHVYHGLDSSKTAVIDYKTQGIRLGLSASDEFVNMVVYTPKNRPGFCLENQTNATDFINLYAAGVDSACMQEIAPGCEKSGYILCSLLD